MPLRGLLIAGTSHCGKSTLAQTLGAALGWTVQSTDSLGRHPGRPWPTIPQPVEEFYDRLDDETVYWFLRAHHENMARLLTQVIADHVATNAGFVLEGSALRPELVSGLPQPDLMPMLLHAEPAILVERIHRASDYAHCPAAQQRRIDRFVTRSLRDNAENLASAKALGIEIADVSAPNAVQVLAEQLKERLSP